MSYLGIPPFGQTVRTVTTITATTSQTSFTPTGGYTVGYCDVFYNGIKLVAGTDFTATDGLTVVLTAGATSGAVVEIITYGTVTITDAVRRSGDTFSGAVAINNTLAAGNTTITGNTTTTTLNSGNTAITGTLAAGNTTITGTANVSQSLTANTLTVSTNTATFGTAVYHVANGNVGIGSSTPQHRLQVTDTNPRVYVRATANGYATSQYQNDTNVFWVGIDDNTGSGFNGVAHSAVLYNNGATPIIFSTSGTERVRIPSDAGGIQFPASQVASTNANTLDDYEEGTWTPIDLSTAGLTLTSAYGTYVKIGQLVVLQFRFTYPATGSSATAYVGGFPFTVATNNLDNGSGASGFGYCGSSFVPQMHIITGDTKMAFYNLQTSQPNSNMSGAQFRGGICYRTTA